MELARMNDTKNNYFKIRIKLPPVAIYNDIVYKNTRVRLENEIDEVFSKMSYSTVYTAESVNDDTRLDYLFSTSKRKRIGQLRNLIKKHVELKIDGTTTECRSFLKKRYYEELEYFKNNKSINLIYDKSEYRGEDVKKLNDKSNWYSWQKDLYNLLYDKSAKLKTADSRSIHFIRDRQGNSGKSSFIKWIFLQSKENEIGFLTDGTSSQLKASIGSQSPKRVYIIDLPRTKGTKENTLGLMNACESLKNGLITKVMYGDGSTIIMPNPFIIILGNNIPLGGFSVDRWVVWDVKSKKNDFIKTDISESQRKLAKAKISIEEENDRIEERKILKLASEISKRSVKQ